MAIFSLVGFKGIYHYWILSPVAEAIGSSVFRSNIYLCPKGVET